MATLVSYLESNGVITEVPHITLNATELDADDWNIAAHLAPLTKNIYMYEVEPLSLAHWQQLVDKVYGETATLHLSGGTIGKESGKLVARICSNFKNLNLGWGCGGVKFDDFEVFIGQLENYLKKDGNKCEYINFNLIEEDKEKAEAMKDNIGWAVDHISKPMFEGDLGQLVIIKKEQRE